MGRLACVDLPDLPGRLRLHEHHGWRGEGYRSLVNEVVALLCRFSPRVEVSDPEPGVFFMDASGLCALYRSASMWGTTVSQALATADYRHRIAVGFTRFGTYAATRGPIVGPSDMLITFRTAAEERGAALRTPLCRFSLAPETLEMLEQLGVATVADLLALPAGELLMRCGPDLFRLHRSASGELDLPLSPEILHEEVAKDIEIDPPEDDATRLLFRLKQELPALLGQVANRRQAVAHAAVALTFGRAGSEETRLALARPSLDEAVILDLLRLRLEVLTFPAPVSEIRLTLVPAPAEPEQLVLVPERPSRDAAVAERALARLRAEFGDGAVVRARLQDRHLPERQFVWEPVAWVVPARPRSAKGGPTLVRRLYARPVALAGTNSATPRGGPYRLAGGWWGRPAERDYYFIETLRGELLWVFYDRMRRRWFLHGRVE